jgi:2-polyprenyl-3-methyl-5-hydroxy-6-metoxy-1,4-benzoquinol methylase
MPWRAVSDAPTSIEARAQRQTVLTAATHADGRGRSELLREICDGRSVLDVGCVDHESSHVGRAGWLHAELAAVSSRCVGLDTEADGVEAMRDQGYEAFVGRVEEVPGEVRAMAPFDVVVAGELIEHLEAPGALFALAAEILRPGGALVITTPNPYAPWRARAGQLGLVWENADHICYLFPAGLVELAERHGFELRRLSTWSIWKSADSITSSLRLLAKAVARRVLGRPADPTEYPPVGRFRLQLPAAYVNPFEYAVVASRRRRGLCGEHTFYRFELGSGAGS